MPFKLHHLQYLQKNLMFPFFGIIQQDVGRSASLHALLPNPRYRCKHDEYVQAVPRQIQQILRQPRRTRHETCSIPWESWSRCWTQQQRRFVGHFTEFTFLSSKLAEYEPAVESAVKTLGKEMYSLLGLLSAQFYWFCTGGLDQIHFVSSWKLVVGCIWCFWLHFIGSSFFARQWLAFSSTTPRFFERFYAGLNLFHGSKSFSFLNPLWTNYPPSFLLLQLDVVTWCLFIFLGVVGKEGSVSSRPL